MHPEVAWNGLSIMFHLISEAIAIWVEAVATRMEAIASRLEGHCIMFNLIHGTLLHLRSDLNDNLQRTKVLHACLSPARFIQLSCDIPVQVRTPHRLSDEGNAATCPSNSLSGVTLSIVLFPLSLATSYQACSAPGRWICLRGSA